MGRAYKRKVKFNTESIKLEKEPVGLQQQKSTICQHPYFGGE